MRDETAIDRDMRGESRSRRLEAALAELAGRQHGVVAREQLRGLGLSLDAIDRRVQGGRLHVLHRGVYAVGHRAVTRDGHRLAAVLAGGRGAVLSHRSAAALWGIRETARRDVEITAPRGCRRPGIEGHDIRLAPDEVTVRRNIPVTTPARTLLDLAATLNEHQLARAAERAESLRLTSPTSLEALAARYPRRPGVPAIRALNVTDTPTRSVLERRFLSLLDAENLPRPLVNAPAELPNADDPEADITWRDQRLIVELDGFETHSTRAASERDRARDRALQAQGWRVIRITWRQLQEEPQTIAAQLNALLHSS
jgi:predicted transcriptional regulator of viral defense system